MGQSNTKDMANTEKRFDGAVKQLDNLSKTGKQGARDIIEVLRQMEDQVFILKTEKEFLTRQLQRQDSARVGHRPRSLRVDLFSKQTQTDADEEVSLSIMNDSLKTRNEELEQELRKMKETVKQGGNLLTNVAMNVLLPRPEDDKYFPGTEEQDFHRLKIRYEEILNDQDCLNNEIRRLGEELYRSKKNEELYKEKIDHYECELKELKEELNKCHTDAKSNVEKMVLVKNENDSSQKIISELKQTNSDLRKEMGLKINKIDTQENIIHEYESEIDNFKQQLIVLRELKDENTMYQKNIRNLDKKLQDLENQIDRMRNENDSFRHENNETKNELASKIQLIIDKERNIKEIEQRLQQNQSQLEIRGTVIEKKKREVEELTQKLFQKTSELSSVQRERDTDLRNLKNELSIEANKFQNEKIKSEELRESYSKLVEDNSELSQENNKLKAEVKDMEKKNIHTINELKDEIRSFINKQNNLTKEKACLQKENDALQKEIERLAENPREKKQISFHCVLKEPQKSQAVDGILSLLKEHFHDIDLEVVEESKRNKNVPLLVVLYNLSRVTDDAKGALMGVEASSDVALVVLHSKELKKSSDQILTLTDFKRLGKIVDMSFISAKGIITNEITANGVNQLARFIETF